jgi:hypothetical protein
MSDFVKNDTARDAEVRDANLGLTAPVPDVLFGRDLTPDDFQRGPLAAGHARQSPGDGDRFTLFEADQADKAADADGSLGPGVLPTQAVGESYGPTRASDFVRGDIGEANSSGGVARGPMSPEQALGLGKERLRGDNLQADLQPSPMRGGEFPDTAGRSGAGDFAQHQVVKPQIDVAPSLGADSTGIAKSEFAKKEQ